MIDRDERRRLDRDQTRIAFEANAAARGRCACCRRRSYRAGAMSSAPAALAFHVDAAAVAGRVLADAEVLRLHVALAVEIDAAAAGVAVAMRANDREVAEEHLARAADREHRGAAVAVAADERRIGPGIDIVAVVETAGDVDVLVGDEDFLVRVRLIVRDPDEILARIRGSSVNRLLYCVVRTIGGGADLVHDERRRIGRAHQSERHRNRSCTTQSFRGPHDTPPQFPADSIRALPPISRSRCRIWDRSRFRRPGSRRRQDPSVPTGFPLR